MSETTTTTTNFEVINAMVADYITDTGKNPFLDFIDMGEGRIDVEMEEDFEKMLAEKCDNAEEALSDYFSVLIKDIVETLQAQEDSEKSEKSEES
jgi:hypothetical protein